MVFRSLVALAAAVALSAGPAPVAAEAGLPPALADSGVLPAAITPPITTSATAYLGRHLSWTTFDQLSGDGSAGPSEATRLWGVAGGAGLIVETGADGPAGKAASWTSTDGGASWTEHLMTSGPSSFGELVAHAGVYVTYRADGLYSSTDGASWSRAATGPHAIGFIKVAAGPRGFVVFVRNGTSTTTRVWRSATGSSWTADPNQAVVSGFCPQSIAVTSTRIVASGADCATPRTPRVLVNASGRTWVRGTPPRGLRVSGTYARGTSVSYVSSRFLLTGTNSTQTGTWVWSSTNGVSWTHVSSMGRSSWWSADHIVRILRLAPGWVAVGDRDMPADDGQVVTWSSADLVHWTRSVPRLASSCDVTVQMVQEATVVGARMLAVGTAWGMAESCGETWTATVTP